ncbi:MAG: hypothetical protein US89_C0002G0052 [Candidatus Peregrinibacteria bacterium GW2011_GWF2_38_29]|nr:MAG: hypothetical protein US89_C0002G0052 [Candidatus Peregrinibacteria bacterium GW2011_GWF2_38_29]HBB02208.1 hypothetical protein [Candidatus Peregrinibacteria bacterium]
MSLNRLDGDSDQNVINVLNEDPTSVSSYVECKKGTPYYTVTRAVYKLGDVMIKSAPSEICVAMMRSGKMDLSKVRVSSFVNPDLSKGGYLVIDFLQSGDPQVTGDVGVAHSNCAYMDGTIRFIESVMNLPYVKYYKKTS